MTWQSYARERNMFKHPSSNTQAPNPFSWDLNPSWSIYSISYWRKRSISSHRSHKIVWGRVCSSTATSGSVFSVRLSQFLDWSAFQYRSERLQSQWEETRLVFESCRSSDALTLLLSLQAQKELFHDKGARLHGCTSPLQIYPHKSHRTSCHSISYRYRKNLSWLTPPFPLSKIAEGRGTIGYHGMIWTLVLYNALQYICKKVDVLD